MVPTGEDEGIEDEGTFHVLAHTATQKTPNATTKCLVVLKIENDMLKENKALK